MRITIAKITAAAALSGIALLSGAGVASAHCHHPHGALAVGGDASAHKDGGALAVGGDAEAICGAALAVGGDATSQDGDALAVGGDASGA
ncbi:hypothetical protein GCM10009760_34220 [Kitasatospora kazusensis]|uniref:Small secreted domain DUF320 n=1 Tax=Kitasatospora kazusensis TaxID=407974 RepID=A0ABP5LDE5_9ACTN